MRQFSVMTNITARSKQIRSWTKAPRNAFAKSREAFTLIELLVVITIMMILVAATAASFNYSFEADRVRSAARLFQSFLAGARDKAIYANEIRGVRLILDPLDNHAVTGMHYIGAPQREEGTLNFDPAVTVTNDPTGATASLNLGSTWNGLKSRGFFGIGSRIQIPKDSGPWYTILDTSFSSPNFLVALNRPVTDLAGTKTNVSFVLEMTPRILGDAQPVAFPKRVSIDLDGSAVPSRWRPAAGFSDSYFPQMDILFTPRGTLSGDALSLGMLHFHFADTGDVTQWHSISGRSAAQYSIASLPLVPADDPGSTTPIVKYDRLLTTISSRTGNISVHYVNTTNTVLSPTSPIENQKLADDPFSFAETGQVANK